MRLLPGKIWDRVLLYILCVGFLYPFMVWEQTGNTDVIQRWNSARGQYENLRLFLQDAIPEESRGEVTLVYQPERFVPEPRCTEYLRPYLASRSLRTSYAWPTSFETANFYKLIETLPSQELPIVACLGFDYALLDVSRGAASTKDVKEFLDRFDKSAVHSLPGRYHAVMLDRERRKLDAALGTEGVTQARAQLEQACQGILLTEPLPYARFLCAVRPEDKGERDLYFVTTDRAGAEWTAAANEIQGILKHGEYVSLWPGLGWIRVSSHDVYPLIHPERFPMPTDSLNLGPELVRDSGFSRDLEGLSPSLSVSSSPDAPRDLVTWDIVRRGWLRTNTCQRLDRLDTVASNTVVSLPDVEFQQRRSYVVQLRYRLRFGDPPELNLVSPGGKSRCLYVCDSGGWETVTLNVVAPEDRATLVLTWRFYKTGSLLLDSLSVREVLDAEATPSVRTPS